MLKALVGGWVLQEHSKRYISNPLIITSKIWTEFFLSIHCSLFFYINLLFVFLKYLSKREDYLDTDQSSVSVHSLTIVIFFF